MPKSKRKAIEIGRAGLDGDIGARSQGGALFDYALRCEERIVRESFVTNDRIVPTVINKGQSISTTRHNKRQILQRIIASINSVQTDWIAAILRYRQIAAKIDGYEKKLFMWNRGCP